MPHDFRNKSFQKVLRGYAPEEVDEYIAYINEEYRKLERRTVDSERKLTLALKKLDESAKNGAVDSVGPAAREAAEKLLRKTEEECELRVAAAKDAGMAAAEEMIETARKEAGQIYTEAMEKAEAILAEAKTEAEKHREDVAKAQRTAQTIYQEIGSFRERLFALYNEHLDMLDSVTDSTQEFMDDVNKTAGEPLPETEELPEEVTPDAEEAYKAEEASEELLREEEPEIFEETEEADVTELPFEDDFAEDLNGTAELEEELPEKMEDFSDETRIDSEQEEVASNLAFMDRLFASIQAEETVEGEDLYIDLADEEFDEDPADGTDEEGFDDFEEESEAEPLEEELPSIMIDWRNRSAVSAAEEESGAEEEMPMVEESDDFRSADEFDDFEEEPGEFEEENYAENYDDYLPEELPGEEEVFEDAEEDEEEKDEFHDMDQIFNEDKSKREMSLTDEFNIIFSDSKSSQNVKEISRQPIVAPEDPKAAKKHKKF